MFGPMERVLSFINGFTVTNDVSHSNCALWSSPKDCPRWPPEIIMLLNRPWREVPFFGSPSWLFSRQLRKKNDLSLVRFLFNKWIISCCSKCFISIIMFLASIKADCIVLLTTYMKTLSQRVKSFVQNHSGNWSPSGYAKWCHSVSPDSEKSIPRYMCVYMCQTTW